MFFREFVIGYYLKMLEVYRNCRPLVSVILATFNRADYLKTSIDSVIVQDFKNWELIIVDDGSTDNTFEIAYHYIEQYENIKYIRHLNKKLSLSKNTGIQASVGKYIAFIDSDDTYNPDYLIKRVEFMENNPNIDLIEGGAIIIGDPYVKDKRDLSKKINLSECVIGPTFFGKREVFFQVNGFNKDVFYSEDSEFWERAELVFNVQHVDMPGYIYYRDTPGSICNSI